MYRQRPAYKKYYRCSPSPIMSLNLSANSISHSHWDSAQPPVPVSAALLDLLLAQCFCSEQMWSFAHLFKLRSPSKYKTHCMRVCCYAPAGKPWTHWIHHHHSPQKGCAPAWSGADGVNECWRHSAAHHCRHWCCNTGGDTLEVVGWLPPPGQLSSSPRNPIKSPVIIPTTLWLVNNNPRLQSQIQKNPSRFWFCAPQLYR